MNSILEFIVEQEKKASEEDQQSQPPNPHPLYTAAKGAVLAAPADLAGAAVGGAIASKIPSLAGKTFKMLGESHSIGGMVGAAVGGLAANYAVMKHENSQQKQASTNKYIDKVAFIIPGIIGAVASDKGDGVGGAVTGGVAGGVIARKLMHSHGPLPAIVGGSMAGYLGGRGYSKLKESLKTKAKMEVEKQASEGNK